MKYLIRYGINDRCAMKAPGLSLKYLMRLCRMYNEMGKKPLGNNNESGNECAWK